MRIGVMGVGGVGGLLAARLLDAGTEVALVARGRHLEAIRSSGLRLTTPSGDLTVRPTIATDDPGEVGPVDFILFAVKMPDAEAAALACRPMLGPATGVVPFLNGVEATDILAQALGPAHAMMGAAYLFAEIAEPGVIRQTGAALRILFGEADGGQSTRSNALREKLVAAGVDAAAPEDIRIEIWRKFAFLAMLSGFTAASRSPVGVLRGDPRIRDLMGRAVEEVVAVAKARGVILPADTVDRHIAFLDTLPAEARASQAHDLAAGRRLELNWLSGAVSRIGRELGVPVPIHDTLFAVLKPFAEGR